GLAGAVVAHQAVGAGLQRVVGAVGLELDDGGAGFQVARRRGQRLLDSRVRGFRDRVFNQGQPTESEQNSAFHTVTSREDYLKSAGRSCNVSRRMSTTSRRSVSDRRPYLGVVS